MPDLGEIKEMLDQFGTGVEAFKTRHASDLAGLKADLESERKEREALEMRLQRLGLNSGSGEQKGNPEERKAVASFVRNGAGDWSHEAEIKGMSVGSDPDGGYLVLPTMSAGMTTRLFDISPDYS